MNLEGFNRIVYPLVKDSLPGWRVGGFVYVSFWVADRRENPFFVGQTVIGQGSPN
jgi:hypothetical protein